jgi:signal peptidase I
LWKELPVLIVIAIALAILLKTFLVQAFYIPSGSMENTLQVGDRVMVNKVVYHLRDIKRGDVVVFDGLDSFTAEVTIAEPTNPIAKALSWFGSLVGFAPPSEKDFIKRVIGIPGDRVACCDANGKVTVNGVALTEPYLYPGNAPSDHPFSTTVPAGRLWVMGDHRGDSADSRLNGTIPENKVIGRAFVVIWPVGHWSWLSNPSTFDQSGLSTASAAAASSPLGVGLLGAFVLVGGRRWRRGRPRPR